MEELKNNNQPQVGNGWTLYQKLVLAELSRHEEVIGDLREDSINFRVTSSQINQKIDSIMEKIDKIHISQVDMKKYTDEQDEKFAAQKLELESLKWKIGTILVVFTFIINSAFQAFFKFWKT